MTNNKIDEYGITIDKYWNEAYKFEHDSIGCGYNIRASMIHDLLIEYEDNGRRLERERIFKEISTLINSKE